MTYRNGQIPDASLVTIDRGARLLPGPAADWAWIASEVERRYGWRPRPTGSFDGYRPLSGNYYAQTETFLRRYSARSTGNGPYGDVRFWNGVRYVRVNGAAAAVPGTSNHGWGAAVDVADLLSFTSTRFAQFAAVAAQRGWTNTEGRSINEYWHWVAVSTAQAVKNGTYSGGTVPNVPTVTAPAPVTPAVPEPASWEDDIAMDYLTALYLNLTGRKPDALGAIAHLSAIAKGEKTWPQIAAAIAASSESKAFAALGSEAARNTKRLANSKGWI